MCLFPKPSCTPTGKRLFPKTLLAGKELLAFLCLRALCVPLWKRRSVYIYLCMYTKCSSILQRCWGGGGGAVHVLMPFQPLFKTLSLDTIHFYSRQTPFPLVLRGDSSMDALHVTHPTPWASPPLQPPCHSPQASQSCGRSRAAWQMVSINFEPPLKRQNVRPCARQVINPGQPPPLPFLTPSFAVTPPAGTYPH